MLELLKIQNGLIKKPNTEGNYFLDEARYFTNELFTEIINDIDVPTRLPYQKIGHDILVELDGNIVIFIITDVSVDDLIFNNSDEFINYVFNQ